MPEATRKGVDEIKRGEIEKRRKVATPPSTSQLSSTCRNASLADLAGNIEKEEKPNRPAKKQKRESMTAEERGGLPPTLQNVPS